MISIKKADENNIEEIAELYASVTDYLADKDFNPGWKKGLYPIKEDALEGLNEDGLFIALCENRTVGSFIMHKKPADSYFSSYWSQSLPDDRVLVISTFAVHPDFLHDGIGSQMLAFAEDYAREHGVLTLRLDVNIKNLPAIGLYEKCGYSYRGDVIPHYEGCGEGKFSLYEKIL